MRFVYALIALGLAAGVPTKTNAQTWDEYRPAGIGFRIEMPGKPQLRNAENQSRQHGLSGNRGFSGHGFPGDLRHEG